MPAHTRNHRPGPIPGHHTRKQISGGQGKTTSSGAPAGPGPSLTDNPDLRRLLYSPKVFAFVKTASGDILDISSYITGGQVVRKTNAISTAVLTLRNPPVSTLSKLQTPSASDKRVGDFVFTARGAPTFHPMDGITIYLQRLANQPIQVFTGYLDRTPYLQLWPGTVNLYASCTLKRLQYTFWDPALPFVRQFMHHFGWEMGPSDGTLINQSALNVALSDTQNQLKDGSFGSLLFSILQNVGNWAPESIIIEQLPDGLIQKINQIYDQLKKPDQQSMNAVDTFFSAIIGQGGSNNSTGSAVGGSGTPTGASKDIKTLVTTAIADATKYNIPAEMTLAVLGVETDYSGNDTPGSRYTGWFQCQLGGCYIYGPWSKGGYSLADTHDIGLSTNAFSAAAAGWANADPSLRHDLLSWAMKTQGVNANNNPRYPQTWTSYIAKAKGYIQQFGGSSSTSSPSGAAPTSPTNTGGNSFPGHQSHGSSGTHTTNTISSGANLAAQGLAATSSSSPSPYINPFGRVPKGSLTLARTDAGVDFDAAAGTPICAIGDGKVTDITYSADDARGGAGPWMLYQLTGAGPHHGEVVYISERHTPTVARGATFNAGDPISKFGYPSLSGTHIETGFASGTTGTWNALTPAAEGTQSEAGKRFARFLRSVGQTTAQDPGNGPTTASGNGAFYNGTLGTSSATGTGGGSLSGGTSSSSSGSSSTNAEAFGFSISFPTLENTVEAAMLTGRKSLMNDQPLLPFIEQLTGGCLRTFQSMPNGNFWAFFPDYFGGFGRTPYWEIHPIEVLDGTLELTDETFASHVYVVGDTVPLSTDDLILKLNSGGVITIDDAFRLDFLGMTGPSANNVTVNSTLPPGIQNISPIFSPFVKTLVTQLDTPAKTKAGQKAAATTGDGITPSNPDAIALMQRYGARPFLEMDPMIRSPYFEAFLALQRFLQLWAAQFQSNFQFTFMPELYPGGLVAIPEYSLQFYVESVTHSFDYQGGFVTEAVLSAPSSTDQSEILTAGLIPANAIATLPAGQSVSGAGKPTIPPRKTKQIGHHAQGKHRQR